MIQDLIFYAALVISYLVIRGRQGNGLGAQNGASRSFAPKKSRATLKMILVMMLLFGSFGFAILSDTGDKGQLTVTAVSFIIGLFIILRRIATK